MRTLPLLALIVGTGCTIAAFVWAAVHPANDPTRPFVDDARAALSDTAEWFRRGPVEGIPDWEAASMQVQGGDAIHGTRLMVERGCGACHIIPGVAGARGTVGPDLTGFADRAYIAGIMSNRPGELVRWLIDPPRYAPQTAMPDLDLTEDEATDMAAYLYTLRAGS